MVDEGTIFALVNQLNVTTTEDVVEYFQTVYFPDAPTEMIQKLVDLYPTDPAAGSPFGTGDLNQLGPMYKRLAAIIGDYTFVSGRRAVLDATSHKQKTWSYQIADSIPLLG
jgi:carboxylesterase type B